MNPVLLIVDDEPTIRELIGLTVGPLGFEVREAGTLAEARQAFDESQLDLILTDLRLPDGDGMTVVEESASLRRPPAVAVITAYGTPESAVEAMRVGAYDYLSKPIDTNRLRSLVQHGLRLTQAAGPEPNELGSELVGQSPAMQAVRSQAARVAHSEAPVLITGESGTGKELVAQSIHRISTRARHPFVPVNCAAIPEHLIESELFGYRKGAFTGASMDKKGLFQEAEGGTLFLDEVGDLGASVQANLLRALQERAIRPLGATREVPVDVRIVAATNKDLEEEVETGRFREDLFYRLDVLQVHLPPLREHPEDIPEIASALLARRHRRRDDPPPPVLSPGALEKLRSMPLRGNVRELENVLERAISLSDEDTIPPERICGGRERPCEEREAGDHPAGTDAGGFQLDQHLADIERSLIREAMEATSGNKTEAATRLGVSLRSLRYRIQKLGME
ncbi:sigma-54-dependent transcriptional regulator [Thiohalorhabdus sp. Cl-TMA]|uniref:Sigma-54-dependent transcriptional regulator n=1 Tax=Thiohalorhabdus methylotrophus TaxID=3242694 RepID=A0ABV4TQQ6_9GAMM